MPKFKLGDKVRVKGAGRYSGEPGEIVECRQGLVDKGSWYDSRDSLPASSHSTYKVRLVVQFLDDELEIAPT